MDKEHPPINKLCIVKYLIKAADKRAARTATICSLKVQEYVRCKKISDVPVTISVSRGDEVYN